MDTANPIPSLKKSAWGGAARVREGYRSSIGMYGWSCGPM